jgi:3-deoxy-D-manno-octulosonic acid kinase
VAPILRDRYVAIGRARPFRELVVSTRARERGIRTPAVVAGVVYASGLFYRADLVTELVPDAPSLGEWLRKDARDVAREAVLRRAGHAVRALEEARVHHADLSAGNILLAEHGPPWVIDLDRCRVLPRTAPPPTGPMRRRLERSVSEAALRRGAPLSAAERDALRAGFDERR